MQIENVHRVLMSFNPAVLVQAFLRNKSFQFVSVAVHLFLFPRPFKILYVHGCNLKYEGLVLFPPLRSTKTHTAQFDIVQGVFSSLLLLLKFISQPPPHSWLISIKPIKRNPTKPPFLLSILPQNRWGISIHLHCIILVDLPFCASPSHLEWGSDCLIPHFPGVVSTIVLQYFSWLLSTAAINSPINNSQNNESEVCSKSCSYYIHRWGLNGTPEVDIILER